MRIQEKREKIINGLETIVADDKMWRKADYYATICKDALELLKAQEPPTGNWIVRRKSRYATCSNCGHSYADVYDLESWDNYCRHCGAIMEGMKCDD